MARLLSIIAVLAFANLSFCKPTFNLLRTSPPKGSLVVRAQPKHASEYATINAALNAITDDTSSQSIFVYPGTYYEQVSINRTGPLTIYGYSKNTLDYKHNQVVISSGIPASTAGTNDLSASLRIHKDDFALYNVDVKNTYGIGSQAVAISQNGNRVGIYASGLYGYQDTVYANEGTQVYLKGYIQGAVDFIFGGVNHTPRAYFEGNTIGVSGPGWVTASGRVVDDIGVYVFNKNTIVLAPDAANTTSGAVYLGRPWRNFAKVIFKNTLIKAPLNPGIWSIWLDDDERTENILFAEYNTFGSGVVGAARPDFVTLLDKHAANNFTISTTVGSDYAKWVDCHYLS